MIICRFKKLLVLAAFGLAACNVDSTGDGPAWVEQPDSSYGVNGVATVTPDFGELVPIFRVNPFAMKLDAQGRSVSVGQILTNQWHGFLMRLTAEGKRDTSCLKGFGYFDFSPVSTQSSIYDVVPLSSGQMLVAGAGPYAAVARLNEDCSQDKSFGSGGIWTTQFDASNYVKRIAVSPVDGSISGVLKTRSSNFFTIFKLTADGMPFPGFGADGLVQIPVETGGELWTTRVDPQNRILVAGFTSRPGFDSRVVVYRFLPTGVADESFADRGRQTIALGKYAVPKSMALLGNGQILLGGDIFRGPVDDLNGWILRLNADGSVDTGFGTQGSTEFSFYQNLVNSVYDIQVQSDGQIVAAGHANVPVTTNNVTVGGNIFAVYRFMPDGQRDASFGDEGKVGSLAAGSGGTGFALAIDRAGRYLVMGDTNKSVSIIGVKP